MLGMFVTSLYQFLDSQVTKHIDNPLLHHKFPYNLCSGHRIGTAEVESALASHPQCAEAAVVGFEHEVLSYDFCYAKREKQESARNVAEPDWAFFLWQQVKGQGIYVFVTLVDGVLYSEELRRSLVLGCEKACLCQTHWSLL